MGSVGVNINSREELGKWLQGEMLRKVFGRCCDCYRSSESRLPASFPVIITVSLCLPRHCLCCVFWRARLSLGSLVLPVLLYSQWRQRGSEQVTHTGCSLSTEVGWKGYEANAGLKDYLPLLSCPSVCSSVWPCMKTEVWEQPANVAMILRVWAVVVVQTETASPWKGFFGPFVVTAPHQAKWCSGALSPITIRPSKGNDSMS